MQILYNDQTDLLYLRLDDRRQEVVNKVATEDVVVGIEILDASRHVNLQALLPIRRGATPEPG